MDRRLIIKNEFEFDGKKMVNTLKLVECVDFIQVWLNNGHDQDHRKKYAQMRLSREHVGKLIEFLQKVEIKG